MSSQPTVASFLRRVVYASIENPRRVLAAWATIAIVCTPSLLRVQIEASAESVLDKEHPAWAIYQSSLEEFGGDEIIVVAVESEDAFSKRTLEEVAELSRGFSSLPGVRRVDSISTLPVVFVNQESALELDPAFPATEPPTDELANRARLRAEGDRIIRQNLVNLRETTAAINLVQEENPAQHYPALLGRVEAAIEGSNGPFRGAWVSGVPVFQQ